jgi:hypothetical protein
MINVGQVRNQVVDYLAVHGYSPRDADGSDFAKPGSTTRFKVGTSRGEVAITVWERTKQIDVVRIVSDSSLRVALRYLNKVAQ